MKLINLVPGSAEWLQRRTASQASIIMGCSPYCSRTELLRLKVYGGEREVSEWQQKYLLDRGHAIEESARKNMSAFLGETLFVLAGETDDGYLNASFDGISMRPIVWEGKSWNEKKVFSVRAGKAPAEDYWQLVQQAIVAGVDQVWYEVTDGNGRSERLLVSVPETDKQRLIRSWQQFDEDLANYQHQEIIPAPVAAPQMALPAISVQVAGALEVRDNLSAFTDALRAYIHGLNRSPETDQDFADLEASAKLLREAQERIKAERSRARSQIDAMDRMERLADMAEELARTTAIELERLVKAEKENRRAKIVSRARAELDDHVRRLNERIGRPWMPEQFADFAGAIKGKKTLQSVQDATDTALATAKIAANEVADRMQINLYRLRELSAGFDTLFPDAQTLVVRETDAMEAIIRQRIAEHQRQLDVERDRIRQEEAAKVQAAQVPFEKNVAQQAMHPLSAPPPPPAAAPVAATPDDGARIKLGEVNARLDPKGGLTVTADFLARLGFPAVAHDKRAMLYRACDFPAICEAIAKAIAGKPKAVEGATLAGRK